MPRGAVTTAPLCVHTLFISTVEIASSCYLIFFVIHDVIVFFSSLCRIPGLLGAFQCHTTSTQKSFHSSFTPSIDHLYLTGGLTQRRLQIENPLGVICICTNRNIFVEKIHSHRHFLHITRAQVRAHHVHF